PGEQPVVDLAEVPGGAEGDTLVVELVDDQVPALADLADHHADRDADVRVVGGVGVVAAVHGGDGRPGEAGVVRGDDHHGDALVPPGVRVGAGGQPDVLGVVGAAGEGLLAVHHVVVAVEDRRG